jgi:hypothetical protein
MNVRGELAQLPNFLSVLLVVALAVVTLAFRVIALVTAVFADGFERTEQVLSRRYGITPIGGRLIVLPTDPQPAAA